MSEIRVAAGAIAVAALAVFASLNSYSISKQVADRLPDAFGVGSAETRMAGAMQILPASGVIGYISDVPMDQNAGTAAFLAAQYASAPRALVNNASQSEFVLGNFAKPADFAALGAKSGLSLVRDFGDGVVVFRRAKP